MNTSVRTSHVILLIASLCLAAAAGGCGGGGDDSGGSTPPPTGTQGGLLVQITDLPLDNLIKFEITVVSIELDPGNVEVLPQPVRVELTGLQLSKAVLRLAETVPVGSYNRVTIQFSDPEIKFCPDLLGDCSNPTEIEPTLTNSTVEKTVSFSISGTSGTALLIDFDLEASIETDGVGNIIGVDPQVTCTTQSLGAEDDEFEAKGRVLDITRDTSTTGSFVLEAFGSCQRITVTVDGITEFEDFDEAGLSNTFESLAVDQVVEVEADADAEGPIFANVVELEEPDDDEEVEGTIISEVRSAGGDVTEFTLLAQELATCALGVLTDDMITVTVTGSTELAVDEDDLSALSVDSFKERSELAVGQKVEVEPTGLLDTQITAEKIQLKEQVVKGKVVSAGAISFSIIPRSSLIEAVVIEVQTSSQTEFKGVGSVSELFVNQDVRVRGLVFFVAGQYVIEATGVEAIL